MNSRDTLITELNVLETFNPVVPNAYKDAEIVMLGNLHPLVQLSVLEQMSAKPKLVILDTMDFWMNIVLDDLKNVISKIDVITINDEEARQLSGEYSLVNAAKKIHEMGPKYVVIKKGEHGALLFHNEEMFYAPALPLAEVFDPTGAGDTFAGGFAGYLAKTNDISFDNMKKAIIRGSNTSSKGNAGAKKTFSSSKIKAPCSPFLITTYLGPISEITLAAFTNEYSPDNCLASSSLIVITSTFAMTCFNSANAQSIQKFIVSKTTNFGFLVICSITPSCTKGCKFPNITTSASLYASGTTGLKLSNTFNCVSKVSREFISL
jgi:hypothetical protein